MFSSSSCIWIIWMIFHDCRSLWYFRHFSYLSYLLYFCIFCADHIFFFSILQHRAFPTIAEATPGFPVLTFFLDTDNVSVPAHRKCDGAIILSYYINACIVISKFTFIIQHQPMIRHFPNSCKPIFSPMWFTPLQ